MAKDIFHETVKEALVADGWKITDDPFRVAVGRRMAFIDLAAKELFTALRDEQEIIVEVKSFVSPSLLEDLYKAVGQYTVYRLALIRQGTTLPLYLAISADTWKLILAEQVDVFFQDLSIRLLIFNVETKRVNQWIS
jgi:hypothetical protein